MAATMTERDGEPVIRDAGEGDFAAIAAITNHYIVETTIHFGDREVTAEELAAQWRADRARYPWLVVAVGGEGSEQVVGYAKAGTWRARPAYRWTAETGIYLAPAACGRGLGRRLYAALLDELEARGFRSAIGGIALPNLASVALHEALGFEHVGTFRDAGWKFGRWHAVGFWQRRFGDGVDGPERTSS